MLGSVCMFHKECGLYFISVISCVMLWNRGGPKSHLWIFFPKMCVWCRGRGGELFASEPLKFLKCRMFSLGQLIIDIRNSRFSDGELEQGLLGENKGCSITVDYYTCKPNYPLWDSAQA